MTEINPPVRSHGIALDLPKRKQTPAQELASWFMQQNDYGSSAALHHACCTLLAMGLHVSSGLGRQPPSFETMPAKAQPKTLE